MRQFSCCQHKFGDFHFLVIALLALVVFSDECLLIAFGFLSVDYDMFGELVNVSPDLLVRFFEAMPRGASQTSQQMSSVLAVRGWFCALVTDVSRLHHVFFRRTTQISFLCFAMLLELRPRTKFCIARFLSPASLLMQKPTRHFVMDAFRGLHLFMVPHP